MSPRKHSSDHNCMLVFPSLLVKEGQFKEQGITLFHILAAKNLKVNCKFLSSWKKKVLFYGRTQRPCFLKNSP